MIFLKMMKLAVVALFFITSIAAAQNEASATLNVYLNSIQSIRLNESQSDVAISLNTASEYINGKAVNQQDHIEIMSTTDYEIKVSAATHLTGTAATIDIGTVTLTPAYGAFGTPGSGAIDLMPVTLSLNNNTLIHSSVGDTQRTFNVQYRVSGGEEYLNKPQGTYTTTIIYTILSP